MVIDNEKSLKTSLAFAPKSEYCTITLAYLAYRQGQSRRWGSQIAD